MVRLILIPSNPNPNNPFGKEVAEAASRRLMELKYEGLQNVICSMVCKNHPSFDNTITINDNDGNTTFDCCCEDFRNSLNDWLKMGKV